MKLVLVIFTSLLKIQYRSYKKFNEADFLKDITDTPFDKCLKIRDNEAAYGSFKDTFFSITNKHAPLKTKMIRGNQAPFMTKELSKQIMIRSMADASINDLLLGIPYDPPKSDMKRQKLIECVLTGNSKQYLGNAYTKE